MNIIQYARKFDEVDYVTHPFSDVDSLVLCQISYQSFDDLYNCFDCLIKVKDLQLHSEHITHDTLYPNKNRKLIKALSQGFRFAELDMQYFSYDFNESKHIQFAAMTFMNKDFAYIAFRGTDITITGWKEDLLFASNKVIPSQELALEYAKKVINLIPKEKKIYIGGHSKGGNLATHVGTYLPKELQDRVTFVFDHDGPGFSYDIFKTEEFKRIKTRIKRTIPRNSLIGVLLNNNHKAQIIKSKAVTGLYQHDPLRWEIKRNGYFINYDDRSQESKELEATIDKIVETMNKDEEHKLIKMIGEWFDSAGITTVKQIRRKLIPLIKSINKSISEEQNEDIKEDLKAIIPLIVKATLYRHRNLKRIKQRRKIITSNNEKQVS